jgi:hypothetical protein
MDDLLRELRSMDAELADLSDQQLVTFLCCLIETLDDDPVQDPASAPGPRARTLAKLAAARRSRE